jgi:predicted O-methyltransferase YrrM
MTSVEASKLFEDKTLDFVFIDGAHDYDSVFDDIHHWFPKVKVGGYISGDDLDWRGVNMAVYDNFENNFISIKGKTWIKQKHQV